MGPVSRCSKSTTPIFPVGRMGPNQTVHAHYFYPGGLGATLATASYGIEFLDFLWPTIATSYITVPSESAYVECLCQIVKLHPLHVILWAELIHDGDDAAHPADHSLVIVLQAVLTRWDRGPGFACMGHGTPGIQIVNFSCGNEREVGTDMRSLNSPHPMRHDILGWKRVPNHHLRISSPRGSRTVALPQAYFFPLWPLSLVCHLLVWPVQYTVYTWSWDQVSEGQR